MGKIFQAVRVKYDSLNTWVKIAILAGGTQSLVQLQAVFSGSELKWQDFALIWVGVALNIVAQHILNLKKSEKEEKTSK